jgi:hypothetical protein
MHEAFLAVELMKRRLSQKRLRPLERMLSNACRLYVTRPSAANAADRYEPVARSLVQLQLSFLLWEHARLNSLGIRGYRARDVTIEALEASRDRVHGLGTVLLVRTVRGELERRSQAFRFHCAVPSRFRTARGGPRPELVLLSAAGTA